MLLLLHHCLCLPDLTFDFEILLVKIKENTQQFQINQENMYIFSSNWSRKNRGKSRKNQGTFFREVVRTMILTEEESYLHQLRKRCL